MRLTGRMLWKDPNIIYTPLFLQDDPDWDFDNLLKSLSNKKSIFLKNIYWSIEKDHQIKRLVDWLALRNNPNHRYIFLCNTGIEVSKLRNNNIEAYLIHQNGFVDPKLFQPDFEKPKKYSAVYNATIHPYKRYELASEVKDLSIITRDIDFEYLNNTLKPIMLLDIKNEFGENGKPIQIPRSNLISLYSEAYCGLALSAEEGAMFASMEYLLCGLPIVSTRSAGGRDHFFTSLNSVIVQDNSLAVAEAVDKFKQDSSRDIANSIRNQAIYLQSIEINKFKILLGSLLTQFGYFIDPDDVYSYSYLNSLGAYYKNATCFFEEESERLELNKFL
jgi:glycosyltransferase involved in cell wall biosynthesis